MTTSDQPRLEPARIEALYREHAAELRYFLLGMVRDAELADEFLQMTYVKAMESAQSADPASIKGWLFRVAHNEVQTFWRRRKAGEKITRVVAGAAPQWQASPEEHATRNETIAAVRLALATLPAEQRQVVRMRFFEGKRFVEIAAELRLPLGTVLTRMRLARKKLVAGLEPRMASLGDES